MTLTAVLVLLSSMLSLCLGFFFGCASQPEEIDGHIRIDGQWYELLWKDNRPVIGNKI